MKRPVLRVAVVGCGAIATRQHLPLLSARDDCEVVAVVDANHERAQAVAQQFGARLGTRTVDELPAGSIDCAIVSTPNALHADIGVTLLERGVHVLIEKPLATTVADCERLERAAQARQAVLAVGLMRRFAHVGRFARAAIQGGVLGKVEDFEILDGFVYAWPTASNAFLRRDIAGGGVLMDLGAHALDQVLWWLGDVANVSYFDDAFGGVEADCLLDLRMASGARGRVEFSRTRDLSCEAVIRGERGELRVSLARSNVRLTLFDGDAQLLGLAGAQGTQVVDEQRPAQLIGMEHDDFFSAIRNGHAPRVTAAEAKRSVALIEQCYRNRKPLSLPWLDVSRLERCA